MSASLVSRSALSAVLCNRTFHQVRNAYLLPFCNASRTFTYPINPSNENPRYNFTAAIPLINASKVLKSLREEKDPNAQKIREVFNRRADDPVFGSRLDAYGIASRKLANAQAFDKVEEILEKLLEETKPCTEEIAIRVMKFYGRASMPDHAVRTFERLKDLGISPSVKSFNSFLASLIDAGKPERVHDFLDKIKDFGFSRTVYTYNISVKAFCETKDYESALRVLQTMKEKHCEPDAVTYCTIIDSLYAPSTYNEIGKFQVEKLMDELLRSCTSGSLSYAVRIRRFCKNDNTNEAMDLLKETVSKRVTLDDHTLNNLVIALCMDKKLEQAKTVLAMIRDPRKRHVKAYNVLTRYLVKEGQLDTAIKMCNDMFDNGRLPEVLTVDNVFSSVALSKRLQTFQKEEAQKLIRRVRKLLPASLMSKWERKVGWVFSA